MKLEKKLVGKRVRIEWKHPADEWPWFRVQEVKPKAGKLVLRGIDYPDGSGHHDGSTTTAHTFEISRIEVIDD